MSFRHFSAMLLALIPLHALAESKTNASNKNAPWVKMRPATNSILCTASNGVKPTTAKTVLCWYCHAMPQPTYPMLKADPPHSQAVGQLLTIRPSNAVLMAWLAQAPR